MQLIATMEQTQSLLQQIRHLPICMVRIIQNKGVIILGFGKLFTVKRISTADERFSIIEKHIPQYALHVSGGIVVASNGAEQLLSPDADLETFASIESSLLTKEVHTASMDAVHNVILNCDGITIQSIPLVFTDARKWMLYQPGTEEDRLIVFAEKCMIASRLHRRWSADYPDARDRWYNFNDFFGEGNIPPNAVKSDSLEVLHSLVGMQLCRITKSPDVNLFDFGFAHCEKNAVNTERCILHITCSFLIAWKDGTSATYYGDSPADILLSNTTQYTGQAVKNVALGEGNRLTLDFDLFQITIVPADDGKESWRFFVKEPQGKHLVASNSWIAFT